MKTLITENELARRVKLLAIEISEDYRGKPLLLVGVLTGSFIFLADLCRRLSIPHQIDFLGVASMNGTESSGVVKILKDLSNPVDEAHVLVVEDILDTGLTLDYITRILEERSPLSLRTCVLLDKPDARKIDFQADYVGFGIPNVYVVGYGLDRDGDLRHLPYIGISEA